MMLYGASSCAAACVNPRTANFVELYADRMGKPSNPAIEDAETMCPVFLPSLIIFFAAACTP